MINTQEVELSLNRDRNVQAFAGVSLELPTWDQITTLLDFASNVTPKKGQRWLTESLRELPNVGAFTLHLDDLQTKYARRLLTGVSKTWDLLNLSHPVGLQFAVDLTISFIPSPISVPGRTKAEAVDRFYWGVLGASEFHPKGSPDSLKLSAGDVIFCPAGNPPQLVPLTPSAFITFTAIEG